MKKDAETILKTHVPLLLLSLYCLYNDSTNVQSMPPPKSTTGHISWIVLSGTGGDEINMNTNNTQTAIDANMANSQVWHSILGHITKQSCLGKVYSSVKDTNKILEKVSSKNVVKALIIDAVMSHPLLKWQNICEMTSIVKQLVWSCCHGVLYIHRWPKWDDASDMNSLDVATWKF